MLYFTIQTFGSDQFSLNWINHPNNNGILNVFRYTGVGTIINDELVCAYILQ
jgi:hypothetical protein